MTTRTRLLLFVVFFVALPLAAQSWAARATETWAGVDALSSTTTLNFDSVDTSALPRSVDAAAYLTSNGISVSSLSPGTRLVIANDLAYYGGNAVRAPSSPNTLTQMGSNAPIQFTLTFARPLQSLAFKRSALVAGPTGVSHPYWKATALDSAGTQIGASVGESDLRSLTNVPAASFSLSGTGIVSVRFDSENRGTGFNAVVLDDFVLTLDPVVPPTVTSFTATPSTINAGSSSTLSWTTTNATFVTIGGVTGTKAANGSLSVTPAATTTYTLTATGPGGTATTTATVTVKPLPPAVTSFTANPAATIVGQSSSLSWTTTNTTSVAIGGVGDSLPPNGSVSVTPAATTTYTLTATGAGGTATAQTTVTTIPAVTSINFDSVNTSAIPHSVDATAYLNSNGMTVSSITAGTRLVIDNDLAYYNGSAVRAPSSPNTLTQVGSNSPVQFTLKFARPLQSFGFKRSALVAGPTGVSHPYWKATALNAAGAQIGTSVGEDVLHSFADVPAAAFSLNGPGIVSVRFDSENRGSGFNAVVLDDFVLGGTCLPNTTTLCLNGSRFAVRTSWRTSDGKTGQGQAVGLTEDTGYFWFFSASNVEVVAKVVDACAFSSRFWVFAGGLTDVGVVLTVTDSKTGQTRTYTSPLGVAFQPVQDTNAFVACP